MNKEEKMIKARIRSTYGENHQIFGAYDEDLAAKCRNGVFVGKRTDDIVAFRGIPFAKPPVGELRWKRPEPVEDDEAVFEAYYNGKSPIQTEWLTEQASYYPQSEDCLYLNVWTNRSCDNNQKPVMVFLHGGAYGWGGTADPLYDGHNFVTENPDIILVTVGYRIGLMGFVDLSYLEGGDEYPDAPNLGLLDQIEALRWLRANIRAFGGDPSNVTIFGESAGGGSVSLLPIIPQAKGLFKRVIAESGSVALTFSKEECKAFTDYLIKACGTNKMEDLLAMSEADLMRINEKVNHHNNFPQRDGRLIPVNPYEAYLNGVTAGIDVLYGTNSNEMNYWVGEVGGIVPFRVGMKVAFENDMRLFSREDKARVGKFMKLRKGHDLWKIVEFFNDIIFRLPMIRQAELHNLNGGKAYIYYWMERSTIEYRGACHAVELAYVFGNTQETIYTGAPADEEMSKQVMQMWTNFARCGDPSIDGFDWKPYEPGERQTAVIAKDNIRMHSDVLSEQRKLLMPIIKYMVNPSYADLDYNVPYTRKIFGMAAAGLTAIVSGIALIHLLRDK